MDRSPAKYIIDTLNIFYNGIELFECKKRLSTKLIIILSKPGFIRTNLNLQQLVLEMKTYSVECRKDADVKNPVISKLKEYFIWNVTQQACGLLSSLSIETLLSKIQLLRNILL